MTLNATLVRFWGFFLVSIALFQNSCLGLDTSSPWPQFGIDPAGHRQSSFIGPVSLPSIKWKFATGNIVYSSPMIDSNSTVYVPSFDGNLYAIAENDSLSWSRFLGGQIRGSVGLTSSGDVLLLGPNAFYAFDPNGSTIFSKANIANNDPSVTVASDGTYYVSNAGTGTMLAFDAAGSQKWTVAMGAGVQGTPVIGPTGDIYVSINNGNFLRAVSGTGTLKWSFPIPGQNVKSATVGDDGTIYAGGQDGDFFAINPDGTEKWRFTPPSDIYTAAALGHNHDVIFAASDGIYSLDTSGSLNWYYGDVSFGHGSVFVDAQGNVFATRNNRVISLNSAGTLRWNFSLDPSEYIYSSITLDKNGVLYVGAQGGVYALAVPEPGQLVWLTISAWGFARSRRRMQQSRA